MLQTAFEPSGAAAAIRRYGVTTMAGVDEVFYKMLDVFPEPHPFPSLRYVVFGSLDEFAQDFIRTAEARSLKAVGAYGMSEPGMFALQPSTASADHRAPGRRYSSKSAGPDSRARCRARSSVPPGEARRT